MATLIQIRRDTQANWTTNDPILASGEIAFSTDQYKIKIGDGTSNWSSLAYMTATPTEITNQINAAISGLIDSAPGTLDTLNELAAALNDDPDFFNTVATNLSNHESDTTNVHGIADTSLLATTSYVDTAESDAIASANSYSDGLAVNYDAAGSAAAVASDLTDHENTTTNVHGIADTSLLATTSYVDTAESDAVSSANSYSDSLAVNYDSAGAAATAESNANSYTDSAITTHNNVTTSVHGISDTANLVYTNDSRLSDSRTPTAHASSHESGGTDELTLAQSQITNLTTDLAAKAPIDSPTLTGTPAAPTAAAGTNSTQIATTSFVQTAVSNLVDSAPTTLDTLNELAAALNDDPNFATTVTNSIADKQPLDADLTAIAALAGTSGFLKKTAADTWSLDTNTYLTGNQTITLTGDVSGSGTTSISVTVADDSHNHIISNVDGLQTALDAKAPLSSPTLTGTPAAPTAAVDTNTTQIATTAYVIGQGYLKSSSYTAADVLTKIKTVDGATSGLDADLLDGQHGSYYLDWTNVTNKPDPTITLSGDASGSLTLTDLAGGTLTVTVADDSHNHTISNIDGLQTVLDLKAPRAWPTFTGTAQFAAVTVTGTLTAATLTLTTADTDTSASHYFIETASDGTIRPKTLANVRTEIVTKDAMLAASEITTNAQTGTSYTLVLADKGKLVELNNAAAISLTIPTNASVAFPIGTKIDLLQTGAGQVTIAAGSGVTINSKDGNLNLTGQWSAATLVKRATDTWVLIGDLSA